MKNSEVIANIISYLQNSMEKKGINRSRLFELCEEKGGKVAEKTIYNMFKRPASTTVSTLLKVCDGLDLNLAAIFHAIEIAKTAPQDSDHKLIYDIKNPAYTHYTGEYHVFFLPTAPDASGDKPPVHGTLTFGDIHSTHECYATLDIDSGDLTNEGEPFVKHYEGTLIYSTNGIMFCTLVSNSYGDMWFLTFSHGNLNNSDLACVVGCAATSSAGINRFPAIHRFCLCNKKEYPDIDDKTLNSIKGILRLQNDYLFVQKDIVEEYLQRDDLDPAYKANLTNYLNIAKEYYALSKPVLHDGVSPAAFAKLDAELSDRSGMERIMHIKDYDSAQLTNILHNSECSK